MLIPLLFLLAAQVDLLSPHGEKAIVLLFIRSDCPISNRYAPEIKRLYRKYSADGVAFHVIYPEPGLTADAMQRHRREYGYNIPALLDAEHQYVNRATVRITPEAAVFANGRLIYRGRIDDRFPDLGSARAAAERHELEEVLQRVLAGKSVRFFETKAVGCAIEDAR